jgi:hypothetical protein
MHDSEPRPNRDLLDDLPRGVARRVKAELDPSERILWVGQPRPDLVGQGAGCAVALGIILIGFALIWMAIPLAIVFLGAAVGVAADDPGGGLCGLPFLCAVPFGIPFLVIGGLMAASSKRQRRAASKTCYVLTSQRALVLEGGVFGWSTVRSFGPKQLANLVREERGDGCGSLIFQESLQGASDRVWTRRSGFIAIEDVAHVEDLIRHHLLKPDG